MSKVRVPLKLYKYMPDNEWTLENIRNRQLFFRSPDNQSDFFESRFTYRVEISDQHFEAVLASFSTLVGDDVIAQIKDSERTEQRHSLIDLLHAVEENVFRKQFGVCSFSESESSNYLWDRFANGHKGVCVAFRSFGRFLTENEVILGPMQYTDDFEKALTDANLNFATFFVDALFTKENAYMNEREWRAMREGMGPMPFSADMVAEIYFGANINDDFKSDFVKASHESLGKYVPMYNVVSTNTFGRVMFNQLGAPFFFASPHAMRGMKL